MSNSGAETSNVGSIFLRYELAALSVVVALFIKEILRVYFEPAPTSLFFCAVALSSWFGGFGPGLLASVLSVGLIDYHFHTAFYLSELSVEDVPRMIVFFLSAASISWLSASQERTRESLRRSRDQLELKVRERTAELRQINEELRAEIAERKSAEAALLSSEAQLKEAQASPIWEAMKSMCAQAKPAGRMKFSASWASTRSRVHCFGRISLRMLFIQRTGNMLRERYNEVIRNGKLYDLQCRVVRPDGSVRFVHSMGEPIKDSRSSL